MNNFSPLLFTAISIFFSMSLMFIVACWKRDNSIVDIFWGIGFVINTIALYVLYDTREIFDILIICCIALWGIRLAIHIGIRNSGKPEDFRYKNWRNTWEWFYTRSFFQIFMLQGFLMWLILAPIVWSLTHTSSIVFNALHITSIILGICIFSLGFFFESVGDWQLMAFKKNPANKGKIIQTGLWSLTRHPNYFGEVCLWWGIALILLPLSPISIISPCIMTFLLLKVSGIPMLEVKYEGNSDYEYYKKRVPAFWPKWRS